MKITVNRRRVGAKNAARAESLARRPFRPAVIEVPSSLGLFPRGVEDAPDSLRAAGLHTRLGESAPVRVKVPPYDQVRDPETQLLNGHGLALLAVQVADAVGAALAGSCFPVVL